MATYTALINVSYGQLAVFCSSLSQPFNDWTQEHVDQGFSWRLGSVSFRALDESGPHSVQIVISDLFCGLNEAAIRVIDVPFDIPEGGNIEVASISDSVPLLLPAGSYCLRCELYGVDSTGVWLVRLIFAKDEARRFAVVRADDELMPGETLLTSAEPAAI